jgi:putative heme iron utilization protein
MNPENVKGIVQAFIDALTPLAQKLQVPIEGLFRWAIRHNYAVAVAEIVVPTVATVIAYKVAKAMYSKMKEWGEVGIMLFILSVTVTIAGIIVSLVLGTNGIMRLVAPEWYTSLDIINMVKAIRG